MKAIRTLPEDEQDVVLSFVLERALVGAPPFTGRAVRMESRPVSTGSELWSSGHWPQWAARLILHRLADGASVAELSSELGIDADAIRGTLEDAGRRQSVSKRLAQAFDLIVAGKTLRQAATEMDVEESMLAAELAPGDQLVNVICGALIGRTALPQLSSQLGVVSQGPLRTMPVRFPEQQYLRLKQWSETHNFPMAVVVRGLVERFLDERERSAG